MTITDFLILCKNLHLDSDAITQLKTKTYSSLLLLLIQVLELSYPNSLSFILCYLCFLEDEAIETFLQIINGSNFYYKLYKNKYSQQKMIQKLVKTLKYNK
jgi:hypothetical protein